MGVTTANGHMKFVRADEKLKRVRNAAREAQHAVKQLQEALDYDVFGRYLILPEEELDADDLLAFIRIAVQDYTHMTKDGPKHHGIEVVVLGFRGEHQLEAHRARRAHDDGTERTEERS